MKSFRLLQKLIVGLTLLIPTLCVSVATADDFHTVTGTWVGSYKTAFPRGHSQFPDQSVNTIMELEIYRQEDNLIWLVNRWRRGEDLPWVIEYGTGSFDLDDRDNLYISEAGPPPESWANTGTLIGEYDDGKLYLNYFGPGDGITFSVELRRVGG